MTEQEIERCLERLSTCKAADIMNFDYAGTLAYIQRLKAENAALKEKLEKAVILPCKVGDTIYEATPAGIREWLVTSIELKDYGFKANCEGKNDFKLHWHFVKTDCCNDFECKVEMCEAWNCNGCDYEKYRKKYFCDSIRKTKAFYAAGYRKQSDVIKEFVEKVKDKFFYDLDSERSINPVSIYRFTDKEIDELAAEFGVEVK